MFGSRFLPSLLVLGLLAPGCAYPRRGTPLREVPSERIAREQVPDGLWRLVVIAAEIPPKKRGGLAWDDPEGAPDPFAKLIVDGRQLWQSAVLENTLAPKFDASPPRNLAFAQNQRVRFELWDKDGLSQDPIGVYEGRALGNAIVGADTLVKLEGGAILTVRVEPPRAHTGTGITRYESRKRSLVLLEVLPSSPAGRAGLKPGDRIVAIDGQPIEKLGRKRADSALALLQERKSELTVKRNEEYRSVKLDDGYVWLSL